MMETSFENRLQRIQQHREASAGPRPDAPKPHKARNRRERLALALAYLEQGGVTGAYAYTPLFRGLARIGIIFKPLHYRSWIGLTLFFVGMMTVLTGFAIYAGLLMGSMPRFAYRIIELGPTVFFAISILFGVGFAAVHKVKAAAIGLPRWRDL